MTKKELKVLGFGILGIVILLIVLRLFNAIDAAQGIQILITFTLVGVTLAYVKRTADIARATKEQADASVKMAEEMREQRLMASRPIIVQKSVPFKAAGTNLSDYFEIYNDSNVPAIELEIILLDKDEKELAIQKETFFLRAGENPIHFHPTGLESQIGSTCYLVSQYRGILSGETEQRWYQTRLPFVPKKSQRGDKIIIQPKELKFRESDKKESF